jgi:hypothetical protein
VASTFFARIDHLIDSVGSGKIVAGCTVNQPYAQNQHQSVWFEHPHGGRALYLSGPLMENYFRLMSELARGAITPFGSMIDRRMIDIAEWMARAVLENAPIETGQLRTSGNPWVKDKGVPIYDRPPISPRELG